MKKLFILVSLYFLFATSTHGGVGPCYYDIGQSDECRIQQLEEAQQQLELENENLQERYIKLQNNSVILGSLDEETLLLKEEKNVVNYETIIELLIKKQDLLSNNILLLSDDDCLNPNNCSVSQDNLELVTLYRTKITALDNEIQSTQEELDIMLKLEEEQAEQEKQQLLLEERTERSGEYLQRANKDFENGDYKDAGENYERACGLFEDYGCYYKAGLSHFELAKKYYENIDNYGYDRLFNTSIKEATESLEKATEITDDTVEVEQAIELLEAIKNYPNKEEEETIQQSVEDTGNKQVELIWSRIEELTSGQSETEKQATYTLLITKLEEYISKSQDEALKEILTEIKIRLKNTELEKEEIAVYDRSNEFFKATLQEKTYSCEISATSDILSTIKNKDFTENELIEQIDKSKFNETAQYSNGIYIWGNPNVGFVGHIDTDAKGNIASQRNLTGYGVYEQPIANLYHSEGLKTEIINNSHYTTSFGPDQHLQKLLNEFTKGNYVQLWGDICTTPEYDDGELALTDITQADVDNGKNAKNECWSYGQDRKRVWYYKEGDDLIKHQGLIGEHNFYLLGYEGDIENPTNIIVWDTSTGKHTYPVKEWMRKWEEMDFRSIIIYSE